MKAKIYKNTVNKNRIKSIEMCVDKELDDRSYDRHDEVRDSLKKAVLASVLAFVSNNNSNSYDI